jgi:hypothetical protein
MVSENSKICSFPLVIIMKFDDITSHRIQTIPLQRAYKAWQDVMRHGIQEDILHVGSLKPVPNIPILMRSSL